MEYNNETLKMAVDESETWEANMGGTEILNPLQSIYKHPLPSQPGARKFIILLTDGAVSNTKEVTDFARENASHARIFTIGIGHGASTDLVNGLAGVTGGMAEYVLDETDRLETKTIKLLSATTNPMVDKLDLKWDISGGHVVSLIPPDIPTAIFQGGKVIQYALIKRDSTKGCIGKVSFSGLIEDNLVKYDYDFEFKNSSTLENQLPIHRLAAQCQIRYIENNRESFDNSNSNQGNSDVLSLSLATGILCEKTAFVAIDQKLGQAFSEYLLPKNRCFDDTLLQINMMMQSNCLQAVGFLDAESSMSFKSRSFLRRKGKKISTGDDSSPFSSKVRSFFSHLAPRNWFNSSHTTKDRKPRSVSSHVLSNSVVAREESGRQNVTSKFETLIKLQNFDGSWSMQDELQKLIVSLGLKGDLSSSTIVQQLNLTSDSEPRMDDLVGTLIGIYILRVHFKEKRDDWILLERKALDFIAKNFKNIDAEKLVEDIAKLF